jgi:transposase-like protein
VEETLALVSRGERSNAEIERDLDLYPGQIRAWERRRRGGRPMNSPKSNAEPASAPENIDWQAEAKRLQKENEILCQERDILIKAIAIFTPKSG